jgi:macrolide phosphotransferase
LRPAEKQGADSDVWIANDEWVLRLARRDEVRGWFRKEAALLPALARRLATAVPRFEMLCLERGLVGYRMIRGEPLDDTLLQRHPEKVGSELGDFIAQLHGFDVTEALALGVPVNPLGVPGSYLTLFSHNRPLDPSATAEESGWRDVIARARSDVISGFAQHVSSDDERAIGAVFDAVLDDANAFDFRPTLVHTELGPEHTLFDDDGRLVGVIDWSDACISDPAADLSLSLTLPPESAVRLIDAYGREPDLALPNRVRAYRAVGAYLHLRHAHTMRDDTIKAAAIERLATAIA